MISLLILLICGISIQINIVNKQMFMKLSQNSRFIVIIITVLLKNMWTEQ